MFVCCQDGCKPNLPLSINKVTRTFFVLGFCAGKSDQEVNFFPQLGSRFSDFGMFIYIKSDKGKQHGHQKEINLHFIAQSKQFHGCNLLYHIVDHMWAKT